MLIGKDGEIHHVAEIDYIIKDILKHQNKSFKLKRIREDTKEVIECEEGEVNDTFLAKDFDIGDHSSLIYLNEETVRNQRGVLLYLAKKIGVNLLTGKSIMNVSLPIKIFESRSHLEKLASEFLFLPFYLEKAMSTKDPLERIKAMATWYIISIQLEPQMMKPFNPILGETFQSMIGGYDIACEQISHHPPVSAFQIWNSQDPNTPIVNGKFEFEANTGFSKITGLKRGEIDINFPDTSDRITFTEFPVAEIHGVMKGTRTYDYVRTLKASDEGNNLHLN